MSRRSRIILLLCGSAVLLGAAVVFFFRSHSTDAHLRLVPQDAAIVLKIDVKQLALKADPVRLLENPVFKNSPFRSMVSDPFSSGIDPLENVYGFVSKSGESQAMAIVFNVDDDDKLAEFARANHFGQPVEKDGYYLLATNTHACIAWNDEAGILLYSAGDATALAPAYLQQPQERSITENTQYAAFATQKNDLGLFINNRQLALLNGSVNSLSPLGITDGYGEVLVNFENDRISAVYSNHPEKATMVPILRSNGQDQKQFAAIAPKAPLVYLGLAADLKLLLPAASADENTKQSIEDAEYALGLTDKELQALFTGDLSVAMTDYHDISEYDPRILANNRRMMAAGASEEDLLRLQVPMIYISIGETNDAKVNDMLENIGMTQMNSVWAAPGLDLIVYTAAKDGHLLITNDFYAADSLSRTGTMGGKLPDGVSKASPLLGWCSLDPKKFPEALRDPQAGEAEALVAGVLPWLQPFTDVQLSGRTNHSELIIRVAPGEGNSLHRLLIAYASLTR